MIREIDNKEVWNNFVLSVSFNTFLQSWEWGQVQKETGESIKYFGLYAPAAQFQHLVLDKPSFTLAGSYIESGELYAVALVITVEAKRGRHYLIPHGPIVRDESRARQALLELVRFLKNQAKKDGVSCLRVAPLMLATKENKKLFEDIGFKPAPLHVHAELTLVLDITRSEDEILSGMRKTTRQAIRKAESAGVTTQIVTDSDEALQRFWPLYEQTRERHGFVLWPREMIREQLKLFGVEGRIFTVVARHNNCDVAAAILPHFGKTVFYYHGASLKLPGGVPAAQLVQWAAIKEAKRRGAARYNFWGVAPANKPQHPFAGITVFKKGFGGEVIDYMHAQDLPLSYKYFSLWLVDSYRRMRRGF